MMLWIGQKMQSLFSMSATSLDRLNGRAGVRIKRGAEPWDGSVQWTPTVFYVLPVPAIRGRESAPIRASIHTAGSTPPPKHTTPCRGIPLYFQCPPMHASTQLFQCRISRVWRQVNEVVVVKGLVVLEEDILTLTGRMRCYMEVERMGARCSSNKWSVKRRENHPK